MVFNGLLFKMLVLGKGLQTANIYFGQANSVFLSEMGR